MDTRNITREVRLRHWATLINEKNDSGKTIKAFCEGHGLRPKTYHYWQRKLREAAYLEEYQSQKPELPGDVPVFAEIGINRPKSISGDITVRIGGISCEIRNGAEKDIIENTLCAMSLLC